MKSEVNTDPEKIEEVLSRGVEAIFPNTDFLQAKMLKGERVTLYLGIDPTGPTLHLGHVIPLRKLGEFQKLGHKITLLIGDFTAMIGDPTDKTATRKQLTHEEVLENCKLYQNQASKFISFDGDNKAELKFNSEWFDKLSFKEAVQLMSHFSVQKMLERDMFDVRMKEGKPIYVHEFMYPLMQGYDSVVMNVDGEIGGNDQTWNMLAGRDLVKKIQDREKFVIAMKLIVDPTGKKMGKTEGNMVALDQTPEDIYGKVMSWSDKMIIPGFEIATDVPESEIEEMKTSLASGNNPRDLKVRLAFEIVKICHSESDAQKAEESFDHTFAKGGIPEEVTEVSVAQDTLLVDILLSEKLVESKTEWRRLVEEGAVTDMQSSEKITDSNLAVNTNTTYKIGKRRFIKIKII